MKHPLILFLLLALLPLSSGAQVIKGKVTDRSGLPVPYATVYIQELKLGTTANIRGDYELKLPPGKYLLICQSLGYEPVFADITLDEDPVIRDFVLPEQFYEIPEVRITASGENPAYSIMRRAIGMAPYYLNHVSSYKADVYLKGNLLINRIPRIMERAIKMEARSSSSGTTVSSNRIKEGDSYFMESFNEIEYTAPDKYVQKVISVNSTFPDEGNEISPMDYIQASLYQPIIADVAISPLSPEAFSHYNYSYLGSSPQGNYIINKIEVKPKRKSQQLFGGTIYIIEDLWCLHSVDLTNENIVGRIRMQQLYIPVEQEIWMPVSFKFDINIGILGFRADVSYGSSVKYREVIPNLSLPKPSGIASDIRIRHIDPDTVSSKTRQDIERILQKEELTNRDMVRLSRLMDKESQESIDDTIRKNLEITDRTTYILHRDSVKRDSAWWAGIRPVPLSEIEQQSISRSDSLKVASREGLVTRNDTLRRGRESGKGTVTLRRIVMGHTWSNQNGLRFTNGGLVNLQKLSFNTVDGLVCGTDFRISRRWEDKGTLSLYPDLRWAFSRKALLWSLNTNYSFSGLNQQQIYIRGGVTSRDLNNNGGINPFLNSITSLIFKNNYLKLYEGRYITAGYITAVTNGLNLELSAGFEDRRVLENTTSFSLSSSARDYSVNLPVNEYLDPASDPLHWLRDQKHGMLTASVTYTPRQRYRVSGGRKIPAGSDWPTFRLTWQHGINGLSDPEENNSHFDMFRLEINRRRETGAFTTFSWRIRTGVFADNRNVTWYDFFHFNSQPLPLLLDNYQDIFRLPAYYSLSTPELFGEIHMRYTSPYLVFKLIPGLSNTLMRENLTLSFLGTRYRPAYTELGYTMSEIFLVGEAGIWAGFDNLKFRSIGFKIILNI